MPYFQVLHTLTTLYLPYFEDLTWYSVHEYYLLKQKKLKKLSGTYRENVYR